MRGRGVNDSVFWRSVQPVECSRTTPAGTRTWINICMRSQQDLLICFCDTLALGSASARARTHVCHIHLLFLSTGIFSSRLSVPRSAGNFAWKFTRSQSFSHCFWSCVWCTSTFRQRLGAADHSCEADSRLAAGFRGNASLIMPTDIQQDQTKSSIISGGVIEEILLKIQMKLKQ